MIMQLDVIHIDADECLYDSEQHELMLYLSISLMKLITNNVLVSMGCRFLFLFLFFWILRVYLPFRHRPITAMGDIFQWVVRFHPCRCLAIFFHFSSFFSFSFFFLLLSRSQKIVFNLKCWQLNPKIYLRDFIDFWFNCVRLLNHVKVTMSKPFTLGMKSLVSNLIGPLSCLSFVNVPHLLCDCFRAATAFDWNGQQGRPHIMAGCKTVNKTTTK